jgi:AcrR family transcriptional regulator
MKTARDKLLKVALTLFSEFGYAAVSTKRIATKAKVNEVTLFRLFGSKKNLLAEVIRSQSTNAITDNEFRSKITWDLKEDLVYIGTSYLAMLKKNIHTILLIITESHKNREIREIVSASPQQHNICLRWYLEEQVKRGACRSGMNTAIAAQSFFALFFEYCISRIVIPDEIMCAEELVGHYIDIFINGIETNFASP